MNPSTAMMKIIKYSYKEISTTFSISIQWIELITTIATSEYSVSTNALTAFPILWIMMACMEKVTATPS
jgi:hypothetical protein